NLVVERERLGERGVGAPEAERSETLARGGAQRGGGVLELSGVGRPGPERLDRALQLAAAADAGIPQDRAGGEGAVRHAGILVVSSRPAPPRTASGASAR